MRLDDPQPKILDTGYVRGTWFDWSPDGRWIVYGIAGQDDENFTLYELETDERHELAMGQRGEKIQALFSVDGAELLVNNADVVEGGHWAVGLEGGEARKLTDLAARTYVLRWSTSGSAYFLTEDGAVLEIASPATEPRPFALVDERMVWEGWSDLHVDGDDMYLAVSIQEPRESDVWIADIVDREMR